MDHYAMEQWIDYARGVVTEPVRRALEEHLRTGCRACTRELATWKMICDFAEGEPLREPPPGAVRAVKLAVRTEPSVALRDRSREIAQLIFDSFAQPQPQGVRSAHIAGRQLLYKAGPLLIDMHLQSLANSARRSLTGQVMTADQPSSDVNQLHVHLLSGHKELAHTHTDRFGEFYIEYDSERDLHLSLEVSPEKDVYVSLDDSLWRTPFAG